MYRLSISTCICSNNKDLKAQNSPFKVLTICLQCLLKINVLIDNNF